MTGPRDIQSAATLEELQRRYARALADTPSEELADIRELRGRFLERYASLRSLPGTTAGPETLEDAASDDDVPEIELAKPRSRFWGCGSCVFAAWGTLALIRILIRGLGGG